METPSVITSRVRLRPRADRLRKSLLLALRSALPMYVPRRRGWCLVKFQSGRKKTLHYITPNVGLNHLVLRKKFPSLYFLATVRQTLSGQLPSQVVLVNHID